MNDDPSRMSADSIKFQTRRTIERLTPRTDEELIGEVDRLPAPGLVNPMELNRRLKVSVENLTEQIKTASRSADRLARRLVVLTVVLAVLTLIIVALTAVLVFSGR